MKSAALSPARMAPEAGVWVIAETTDLPTKFARIVVTDDQGRYLIPDLPPAELQRMGARLRPGELAQGEREARHDARTTRRLSHLAKRPQRSTIRRAYWYAMLKIPPAKDFGGSTDIPKNITQDNWLRQMNNVDCIGCHQLGQLSTRTVPPSLGQFASGDGGLDTPHRVWPDWRGHDQPAGGTIRRCSL